MCSIIQFALGSVLRAGADCGDGGTLNRGAPRCVWACTRPAENRSAVCACAIQRSVSTCIFYFARTGPKPASHTPTCAGDAAMRKTYLIWPLGLTSRAKCDVQLWRARVSARECACYSVAPKWRPGWMCGAEGWWIVTGRGCFDCRWYNKMSVFDVRVGLVFMENWLIIFMKKNKGQNGDSCIGIGEF